MSDAAYSPIPTYSVAKELQPVIHVPFPFYVKTNPSIGLCYPCESQFGIWEKDEYDAYTYVERILTEELEPVSLIDSYGDNIKVKFKTKWEAKGEKEDSIVSVYFDSQTSICLTGDINMILDEKEVIFDVP